MNKVDTERNIEFDISISFNPSQMDEIVGWYMENYMPPIYSNLNLSSPDNLDLIRKKASECLLQKGYSEMVMNEEEVFHFTMDVGEEDDG